MLEVLDRLLTFRRRSNRCAAAVDREIDVRVFDAGLGPEVPHLHPRWPIFLVGAVQGPQAALEKDAHREPSGGIGIQHLPALDLRAVEKDRPGLKFMRPDVEVTTS